MNQPLITAIQRFAVNDGPGFRTNVFLKGCPLKCAWCHNPETMAPHPEIFWKKRLCVQCGKCMDACPRDAIEAPVPPEIIAGDEMVYHKIIRERCDRCMKCVDACVYGALEISGRPMSVEAILDEVCKDRPFYANSGGGLTLSGGEPTLYEEFGACLFRGARDRGIHTCFDTNGHCRWEILENLAGQADIVLYDFKHLDPELHKAKTGVDNRLILENLKRLSASGIETWVRMPVIPGFNDSLAYHHRVVEFIKSLPGPVARIDLLPYHNWCEDKYRWLGLEWPMGDLQALDPGFLEIHADIYRESGLTVTIGGSGFEEAA